MASRGMDTPGDGGKIAKQAAAEGYTFICMYYFASSAYKKLLTKTIAKAISDAGVFNVAVYENGYPTNAAYFTADKGSYDAQIAVSKASAATQPHGSPIYFAVDCDAPPVAVKDYFQAVAPYVRAHGYKVGVYGSGAVCKAMQAAGLVDFTWLSQSHGWAGYQDWLPHANIVQGQTGTFHSLDVDWDTSNGNGGGWKI